MVDVHGGELSGRALEDGRAPAAAGVVIDALLALAFAAGLVATLNLAGS